MAFLFISPLAAVLERPLRDILGLLEQIRLAVRDPAGAEATYGTSSIELPLMLEIDRELGAFMAWHQSMSRQKRPGFSLGSAAVGFLLGFWIGGD